jgi:CBS domain-containing protein
MAAILGGTMRAPLTATFFAVELTGNTHILLPLLAASVAAFALTVLVMKRSILTERIARRGLHLTREYGIDPFLDTRVRDIMYREVDTLPATMEIGQAVTYFTDAEDQARHKSYPVVDADGVVVGIVSRTDILRWTREGWTEDETLRDRGGELTIGYPDELVGQLVDRMAIRDVGRVPIVERESGRLVGLVARRDILRTRARVRVEELQRAKLLHVRKKVILPVVKDS